jgi:hypothetical protein
LLGLTLERAQRLDEAGVRRLVDAAVKGIAGTELQRLRYEAPGLPGPLTVERVALVDPQLSEGRLIGGTGVMEAASLPLDPAMARQAGVMLPGLPLGERIVLSAVADQRYDAQRRQVALDYSFTLHEALELGVAVTLGDLDTPLHAGMGDADLQAALLGASLVGGRAVLADLGYVPAAVRSAARRQNMPEEAFRAMLVEQVAIALRRLGLTALSVEASEAVSRFLAAPERLSVSLNPAEPVPLLALAIAGEPAQMAELLAPKIAADGE